MQTNRHDLQTETVNLTNDTTINQKDDVDDWHSGSVPTIAVIYLTLPVVNYK